MATGETVRTGVKLLRALPFPALPPSLDKPGSTALGGRTPPRVFKPRHGRSLARLATSSEGAGASARRAITNVASKSYHDSIKSESHHKTETERDVKTWTSARRKSS